MLRWLLLVTAAAGWTPGIEPLDVGLPAEELPSRRCQSCHPDDHAEWEGSRHRAAHTNALYQAGLMAEPRSFCVYCHSPLTAQADEVLPNLAWYGSHDPRRPRFRPPPPRQPEPLSGEGIGCVACHVRDGVVHGSGTGELAPHPVEQDPGLADGTLCRGCHEFPMPSFTAAGVVLTDVPMQSTWSEWQAWRGAGGAQTCVDCHMPRGEHRFTGANDRELLESAVDVVVKRRDDRLLFTLQSRGVGHDLPSGDLFRNLTLEVADGEGWRVIDRMGRTFELRIDEQTGAVSKQLASNTALGPGQPRVVTTLAAPRTAWRLVYHFGAGHDELRGLVPDDELTAVVASGVR